MIFEVKFEEYTEWYQAKNQLHLLQSYENEHFGFQDIQSVTEISDEEAKKINIRNFDYEDDPLTMPEFIPLYDLAVGDDFVMLASNEI